MTTEERDLISNLFDRLHTADAAPKDREAEQLIQQKVAAQPSAPYLMAQTVLVQEHALNNAQTRIKDLETRLAEATKSHSQQSAGGGGFLSGLFGGKHADPSPAQTQTNTPPPLPVRQQPQPVAYAPAAGYAPAPAPASSGSGFMGTALAAAAGVAGGSLLYNGLENMLGHGGGMFGTGSHMGGGGFMGGGGGYGGGGQPTEVINNYYEGGGTAQRGDLGGFGGGTNDGGTFLGKLAESDLTTSGDSGMDTPPHDDFAAPSDNVTTTEDDNGAYSTPPMDDPNDGGGFLSDDSSSNFDSGSGGGDDGGSLV